MADKALKFEVQVGTDGAVSGLRVISNTVDGTTQSIRAGFEGIGSSVTGASGQFRNFAKEAGGPMESVTDHIRGMRQEMRLSGFMAAQIAELGIASKGAAGEVTGLFAAFALGGGIGVAIESVKLLFKAFSDSGGEVKKATDEAIKSITELHDKISDYIAAVQKETEIEKMRRKDLAPLEEKESAQKSALIGLTDKLAAAQNRLTQAQKAGATGSDLATLQMDVDLRTHAVEEAQKLLGITQQQVAAAKQDIDKAAGVTKTAEKQAEQAKDLEELKKFQDQWNEYRQQSYQQDQDKWKQHLLDVEKAQQDHAVRLSKAELESRKAIDKMLADQDKVKLDRQQAIEAAEDAEQQKRAQTIKRVADQMAASATSTLRSIVDGSQSAGDAIKGLFENIAFEVIGTLIRLGVEQIATTIAGTVVAKASAVSVTQGHIAEAIAGAAASQAWIPGIGPFLAGNAAADMGFLLEGMTAPLLSSKGGLDRVPFDGMGAILHKDETVLSAPYAKGLRKIIANQQTGASGGGEVHNHYWQAIDGPSVQRFVESGAFRRSMRESRRNGLSP